MVEHGKDKDYGGWLGFGLVLKIWKGSLWRTQKGVGSNEISSCVGCLRWIHKKCSDIKGPYPDFRCA